jgi:hypothetical protein
VKLCSKDWAQVCKVDDELQKLSIAGNELLAIWPPTSKKVFFFI